MSLRKQIMEAIFEVNNEIHRIKVSLASTQNAEKSLSIEYLEKAIANLREAKHYVGLAETIDCVEERVENGN